MLKSTALVAALTSAILTAAAAPAGAQTGADQTKLTVKAQVTPNEAGSKRNPRGVRFSVQAAWDHPAGIERPVVAEAFAWFPRGSLYNGGKYPRCSKRTLMRDGPDRCPSKSLMGRATGVAYADTIRTKPRIVIVNGGPRQVWLYTTLYRPALVQSPVPMYIKRTRGKWAYKTRIVVPKVLQVVAGVPVALTSFKASAGRGEWLATTGCPKSRRWRFKVRTEYAGGGSSEFTDSIRCRR
ncbi:MAG TPA: hypothetical protein VHF90_05235 [Thermoleophilaceae bacterium]|nr:hypothetical protein [Thermoleophilaceae bacterium]